MIEKKKQKTFVELEGTLDQLTQNELGAISGGDANGDKGDIYVPPTKPVH